MKVSPTSTSLNALTAWIRALPINAQTFSITRPAYALDLAVLRNALDACIAYADPIVAKQLKPQALPLDTLLLRPAPRGHDIEMILLGWHAVEQAPLLMRGWHILEANGIGRHPGHQMLQLGNWACVNPGQAELDTSDAGTKIRVSTCWPWGNDPQTQPLRMQFDLPLSLPTESCGYNEAPTWGELAMLTAERLAMLVGAQLDTVTRQRISAAAANAMASAWHASVPSAKLVDSYSPAMLRRGVCGWIDFPNGAGLLWPLVAVLPWIHAGRLIRIGFGKPTLVPR